MVSSGSSKNDSKLKRKIVTALKQKTTHVSDYVCPLKNKKPIRRWVALFSKDRGELVHVSKVQLIEVSRASTGSMAICSG